MGFASVVELDLVGYSDVARVLEETLDAEAVARLNEQIQHFVDAGLKSAGAEREQAVLKTTGDGAILAFERAEDAHRFSVEVHTATRKYNTERGPSASQRWFRIGIATGNLYREERNGHDFAGAVVGEAVRLETAARPGEIVADAATVSRLPAELQTAYGPEEIVAGKRDERFVARRYTVVPYSIDARAKRKQGTSPEQRHRERMIKRVRLDWIEGVLKQSLYQVARIELCVETAEQEVERPWNALVQIPDRSPQPLRPGKTAARIFDDLGQALLILGAPGAGKTTFLLELAEELLDSAERDDSDPIPVIFNLSSWAVRRLPLERWLIAELNERSGVPKKRARQWVESEQIAPLLDGLDEVAQEHREACVQAINGFRQEHGLLPIAICSRIADYHDLSVKLRLQNAILIQSLTRPQIEGYLESAGEPLRGLRLALEDDPSLWELLETPLMLWVAMLAYRHTPIVFSPEEGLEGRRRRLLASFVDAMFKRRTTHYKRAKTVHWLSSLARALTRRNQSVFYLEDLNGDWLPDPRGPMARAALPLLSALTAPLFLLAAYCSFIVLVYMIGTALHAAAGAPPMWVPMSLGLPVAGLMSIGILLYFAIASGDLSPAERVRWRTANLRSLLVSKALVRYSVLFLCLELAFSACTYLPFFNRRFGAQVWGFPSDFKELVGTLAIPVFAGVLITFMTMSVRVEQPVRVRPNQGTWSSAKNSLRFGALSALFAGLPLGIFIWRLFVNDSQESSVYQAFSGAIAGGLAGLWIGSVVGLFKGGLFAVRHLITRLALWCSGAAPLRYVPFLESAVDRLFLRRVGGGYSFVHRMVMEYFASMSESHLP